MSRISPRLAPTQVRCGAPVSGVRCWMRVTSWWVRVARRAVGAVGDGDEARRERREALERAATASPPSRHRRREELERDADAIAVGAHVTSSAARRRVRAAAPPPAVPTRRQHVLAVGLDGAQALAHQAGLAEQACAAAPAGAPRRARARTLERLIALEEPEMPAGRECAPCSREQPPSASSAASPQADRAARHRTCAPSAREVAPRPAHRRPRPASTRQSQAAPLGASARAPCAARREWASDGALTRPGAAAVSSSSG